MNGDIDEHGGHRTTMTPQPTWTPFFKKIHGVDVPIVAREETVRLKGGGFAGTIEYWSPVVLDRWREPGRDGVVRRRMAPGKFHRKAVGVGPGSFAYRSWPDPHKRLYWFLMDPRTRRNPYPETPLGVPVAPRLDYESCATKMRGLVAGMSDRQRWALKILLDAPDAVPDLWGGEP